MDIKLFFKSLFVPDFPNSVASLLSYYEPDKRTDHSFIRVKSELRRLNIYIL